jgi:hypothetical protein
MAAMRMRSYLRRYVVSLPCDKGYACVRTEYTDRRHCLRVRPNTDPGPLLMVLTLLPSQVIGQVKGDGQIYELLSPRA